MVFILLARLCSVLGLVLAVHVQIAAQERAPIGIIDIYGLRTIPEQRIREALPVLIGDPSKLEQSALKKQIAAVPGVKEVHLDLVCCAEGKSVLFIGIEEVGTKSSAFRTAPEGSIQLPGDITKAAAELDEALMTAVMKGDHIEDQSQGHSLARNEEARALQLQFIGFAERDLDLLRKVIRTSRNQEDRASAVEVIAYATNKQSIVTDLAYAMNDPSPGVRNNAVRALGLIAGFAQERPELRITVPWAPFVDLINSPIWTDRNKASLALFQLTQKSNPALLKELRSRAVPAFAEMARWKSRDHAFAPYVVLGRMAGFSESEIFQAWREERERFVEAALSRLNQEK